MSRPLHPHRLRREIEKGAGGQYVPAAFAEMRCDGSMGLCILTPTRAPRVHVPPKPWVLGVSPPPLRMMTTLHYCERHRGELTADQLLPDKVKANFERVAKVKWSHDYRPDFDAAFIQWLLTSTPEYREFLELIEVRKETKPIFGGIPLL